MPAMWAGKHAGLNGFRKVAHDSFWAETRRGLKFGPSMLRASSAWNLDSIHVVRTVMRTICCQTLWLMADAHLDLVGVPVQLRHCTMVAHVVQRDGCDEAPLHQH